MNELTLKAETGVNFLEANTNAITLEELTEQCVVPTWANQELTISHQDFINTVHDALVYYTIVKEVLGQEWLNNELFRLGTSRLANLCLSEIVGEEVKFF